MPGGRQHARRSSAARAIGYPIRSDRRTGAGETGPARRRSMDDDRIRLRCRLLARGRLLEFRRRYRLQPGWRQPRRALSPAQQADPIETGSLPTVYRVDPASCTSLELDRAIQPDGRAPLPGRRLGAAPRCAATIARIWRSPATNRSGRVRTSAGAVGSSRLAQPLGPPALMAPRRCSPSLTARALHRASSDRCSSGWQAA